MAQPFSTVAVVGAGYMGTGIAQSLALCGIDVRVMRRHSRAGGGRGGADPRRPHGRVEAGRAPAGTVEDAGAHLSAVGDLAAAVAGADYVQEVVTESLDVKRVVLAQISAAAPETAVIASNTSTIPLKRMVGAVANPERFLIVHWSNPAHSIPGVEIVVGPDTSPAVVESVNAMLAVAGRVGAVVGDVPGFVLNRLQYALVREALLVVEEGVATPEAVDTLMRTILGFRMPFVPPLTMLDMAGLDVYVSGFGIMEEAFGERLSAPPGPQGRRGRRPARHEERPRSVAGLPARGGGRDRRVARAGLRPDEAGPRRDRTHPASESERAMSATATTATTTTPTADTWPIGAATLMFGGTTADGRDVTTAGPSAWRGPFAEIAEAGFTEVDLMSSFIRIGDLDAGGRSDLSRTLEEFGLTISTVPVARRSILDPDPDRAAANLDFALDTVRAAADLGISMVCLGPAPAADPGAAGGALVLAGAGRGEPGRPGGLGPRPWTASPPSATRPVVWACRSPSRCTRGPTSARPSPRCGSSGHRPRQRRSLPGHRQHRQAAPRGRGLADDARADAPPHQLLAAEELPA